MRTLFEPPPNFAKLAESVDCYGENVTESAQVSPALARGIEQVRKSIPAVVAVSERGRAAVVAQAMPNQGLELTASSVRSSVAPASGSNACLVFGDK